MDIKEIIELRERLKGELSTVDKFLEIARKYGANGSDAKSANEPLAVARPIENPNQIALPAIETNSYGAVGNAVLQAIRGCPNRFTIRDVERVLGQLGAPLRRTQIATAMSRFVDSRVRVYQPRRGNQAAIYERV